MPGSSEIFDEYDDLYTRPARRPENNAEAEAKLRALQTEAAALRSIVEAHEATKLSAARSEGYRNGQQSIIDELKAVIRRWDNA